MLKLSDRRKISIALDYLSGRKTISELSRQVYGDSNRPHIYAIIAHGAKLHYQKQHDL